MKKELMLFGGAVCILSAAFAARRASGSIYPKLLLGCARVLTKQIPVTVAVGDHKREGTRGFVEPGEFQNNRSKGLVLWLQNADAVLGCDILVVNLDHGEVLIPNSGRSNYRLLRNKWLIQSDSGAAGVPCGNAKLDAADPSFQQSGNSISFTIPPVPNLPSGRWNITIDPNRSV